MNIHPQYVCDKSGDPVGVFISIEEWEEIQSMCKSALSDWQKSALVAELTGVKTGSVNLTDWEDVKKQVMP